MHEPQRSLAERVHACMLAALYMEAPKATIKVEGIVANYGFDPERLESQRAEVTDLIRQIVTPTFFRGEGGGWSFLKLAETPAGELWGEHRSMEALCVLAIGLKLANWCAPKSVWPALPGGMPYIVFEDLQ